MSFIKSILIQSPECKASLLYKHVFKIKVTEFPYIATTGNFRIDLQVDTHKASLPFLFYDIK